MPSPPRWLQHHLYWRPQMLPGQIHRRLWSGHQFAEARGWQTWSEEKQSWSLHRIAMILPRRHCVGPRLFNVGRRRIKRGGGNALAWAAVGAAEKGQGREEDWKRNQPGIVASD